MLFAVLAPILVALFIPQISKIKHKIHTGYFVALVPLIIFIYFIQFVVLYLIYYLDTTERLGSFYVYLLMFMTAMLGVVLTDNVFVLYSFWELTSISSFLLIGYWHFNERSRYGALKSMLITIFGGLSM